MQSSAAELNSRMKKKAKVRAKPEGSNRKLTVNIAQEIGALVLKRLSSNYPDRRPHIPFTYTCMHIDDPMQHNWHTTKLYQCN